MRLGAAFWSGTSPQILDETIGRLKNIGVKGLGHLSVEKGWSREDLQACRKKFSGQGFFIGEVTMYQYGWQLASSDEAVVKKAIDTLKEGLQDALILKAHCVGISVIGDGPGGVDPWSDSVWKRLVEGIRQVAVEAEELGMDLAFHPGNRGPLDAPEPLRRLLDEVNSLRLKVILDPVNMTNHRNYHNSADFLNYTFDLLGYDIIAAHAKDVFLDDRHLVTKIDEVPLGMGNLDYGTYLQRLDELGPELVFTIEHYRDVGVSGTVASPVYVDYPDGDRENSRAREFIHAVAQSVGVEIH